MSNDPVINSALFNFCNRLDNGPRTAVPSEPRTAEDLAWLRQALAAIESPDKILKQHMQVIELAMGWDSLGGGKREEPAAALDADGNPVANKKLKDEPKPTSLKLVANGTNPVTLDDVLFSLEYLVEELEDINMASEVCLMNGAPILLNLLKISAADFVAPAVKTTTTTSDSTALSVVAELTPAEKAKRAAEAALSRCILKEPVVAELKRNDEVRTLVAKAIAHAVQQNPKAQDVFTTFKWADTVVPMLSFEIEKYINTSAPSSTAAATATEDAAATTATPAEETSSAAAIAATPSSFGVVTGNTVAALLHICSCMSREYDEGTKAFIIKGGVDLLDQLIASPARVSAKIIKRAMFLVEYLATIGISNKLLIEHTANVVFLSAPSTASVIRVTSSSSSTNGAVSDPIADSVLSVDDDAKEDVQRVACSCLSATQEKGKSVVTDILKPMGLGKFLDKALALANAPADDSRWALAKTLRN